LPRKTISKTAIVGPWLPDHPRLHLDADPAARAAGTTA